jgi:hypothetical protein
MIFIEELLPPARVAGKKISKVGTKNKKKEQKDH